MSSRPPDPPADRTTLERIIAERRDKAAALRARGIDPYRNDLAPTVQIAALRARYEATRPAAPPDGSAGRGITPIDGESHRVAGRVMAKRGMGKTVFAPVRDAGGDLQLFLNVDHLAPDDFAHVLPLLDIGDLVVAEGPVFWTRTGELSVLVKRLWIATKSLRPLPDKWHGLTDVEVRYRQRYVDLAVAPDVREVFRKRSLIVRGLRNFLDGRGFLEVETPMMHALLGGAAARPFRTHHNALDLDLYMRIAPELFLKRLVVGGFERVYEINRNFRNEGIDRQHNPEFTMLEFYQAYATYTDLMDLTEEMFGALAREVNGATTVRWNDTDVELAPPWRRLTVRDAVRELGGVAEADRVFEDPIVATRVALACGVSAPEVARALLEGVAAGEGAIPGPGAGPGPSISGPAQLAAELAKNPDLAAGVVERYPNDLERRVRAGHLGYLIFEATAEAKLVQPTFLTQFPLAVSPLARKSDQDPAFCDRFELFVCGTELANGFSELNDPDDQRARFVAQLRARAVGAEETMDYDEDYCRALEVGLPPTAGEGVGIDRLVMLLTGQASIRDVLLFPLMRPE